MGYNKDIEEKFEKRDLVKKSEDFSGWYTNVILKAELADYAPVRGCQIFRPYGFAIWENIQKELDSMIKSTGTENAYFPIFIPYSFLKKEKEHVEGFSPQLAVVTHGGGKELAEPLVVRPTSETIIYDMFSKWISSWRDLPFKVNQWCNIVRWEMRTSLFLRTLEFLWQEGHTCHATHEEGIKEALNILDIYEKFYKEFLALPGFKGKKSDSEKFPGALDTFPYEALMPDGKALQGCTSHDLGQNFSKSFNIQFQDKDDKKKYVWQTSWGLSTRVIGAMIMAHGDDQGLIIPPRIAPIQAIIIPIFEKGKGKKVLEYSQKIEEELRDYDFLVKTDKREQYSPGWKFNEWELKGVPLRLEIGNNEIKGDFVKAVRRDNGKEKIIKSQDLKEEIKSLLEDIQKNLYDKAENFSKQNTREVDSYEDFKRIMKEKKGFLWAFWCERPECEAKIKEETKATSRLLPLKTKEEKGKCIYCGKKAKHKWLFAQSY